MIGYTGFVGQNILVNKSFNYCYNSNNIDDIKGKKFNLLVCAGTPGTQWFANKYPEKDYQSINHLTNCLNKVQANKLVLISTIAVYPEPIKVNEDSIIDESLLSTYGYNRRKLEKFVTNKFDVTIIRLPALFGLALKKNVLFDLINQDRLDKINIESSYQFYNLDNLCHDIDKAINYNINILNIATEPIQIKEIIHSLFNYKIRNSKETVPRIENMLTKFGHYWDSQTNYLYSKEQLLKELKFFIINQKNN